VEKTFEEGCDGQRRNRRVGPAAAVINENAALYHGRPLFAFLSHLFLYLDALARAYVSGRNCQSLPVNNAMHSIPDPNDQAMMSPTRS
jgi:hypothetical protein